MKKYIVEAEFAGYSRGTVVYEVEAESEQDARENWWDGKEIGRNIVRDDTEKEVISVELAKQPNEL